MYIVVVLEGTRPDNFLDLIAFLDGITYIDHYRAHEMGSTAT